MNKNIEEIKEMRELQLSKRKQVEESNKKLQLENEERNKVLREVEEIRNQWINAVEKYDINLSEEENNSKMSPKEIELYNSDCLELSIRVDEKYFKCIEECYGLYCLNGFTNRDERFIEFKNTRMLFSEEEREKYVEFLKTSESVESDVLKIGKSLKGMNKDVKNAQNDNVNKDIKEYKNNKSESKFLINGKKVSEEEFDNKLKEMECEIFKSFWY